MERGQKRLFRPFRIIVQHLISRRNIKTGFKPPFTMGVWKFWLCTSHKVMNYFQFHCFIKKHDLSAFFHHICKKLHQSWSRHRKNLKQVECCRMLSSQRPIVRPLAFCCLLSMRGNLVDFSSAVEVVTERPSTMKIQMVTPRVWQKTGEIIILSGKKVYHGKFSLFYFVSFLRVEKSCQILYSTLTLL